MAGQAAAGAADDRRSLGHLTGPNRGRLGAEIFAMLNRPDRTENLLTALLVVVTALMAVATLASVGVFRP